MEAEQNQIAEVTKPKRGRPKKTTETKPKRGRPKKVVESATPVQVKVTPKLIEIDPSEIDLGWRVRSDLGDVGFLASSIAQLGQLQPILVTNGGDKVHLIAGARRLKACAQLGRKVRAMVVPAPEELIALDMQLAENVKRKDFDLLELAEGVRRRKALYEVAYPEAKRGATLRKGAAEAKGKAAQAAAEDRPAAPRFTLQAAAQIGCSERRVQELVAVAMLPKDMKKELGKATTTEERNRLALACLRKVREEARADRARKRAEAKRNPDLEAAVEAGEVLPVVIHNGGLADYPLMQYRYELIFTRPPEGSLTDLWPRLAEDRDTGPFSWLAKAAGALTEGGQIILMVAIEQVGLYRLALQAAGLRYHEAVVCGWTNPPGRNQSGYVPASCALVRASKGDAAPLFLGLPSESGGVLVDWMTGALTDDPIPLWMADRVLRMHTVQGQWVLDPFAAAGSVGVAAKKLSRAVTLFETEAKLLEKARARLAE